MAKLRGAAPSGFYLSLLSTKQGRFVDKTWQKHPLSTKTGRFVDKMPSGREMGTKWCDFVTNPAKAEEEDEAEDEGRV